MFSPETAILSRLELVELIRTHSLPIVLAKRLATFLVVLSIVIAMVSFIAAVLLLINVPATVLTFQGLSPTIVLGLIIAIALAIAIVPGIFTYFTLPPIYDRDLQVKSQLPEEGDDDETIAIRQCNRKLRRLGHDLNRWREQGLINRHGDVFVSEKIRSNVITYGNHDRARVVFALDVLKLMSHSQLRAILAHETGHIAGNDFVILCLFSEVTKILHFLYMPFHALCVVVKFVFDLIQRLPIGILRYLVAGIGFLIRFFIRIASVPLWLPRALLYWQSQLTEYVADDFGVMLGGSASGLITALMKLENMRLEVGRSGFARKYDLFATVVAHRTSLETNSAIGDVTQFLSELQSSHPHSVRRWTRMARLGFLDRGIR